MRLVPSALGIGASVLVTAAAWAQVPAGSAFQVNSYTTSRQAYPMVAMRRQGDFVVVWDNRFQAGQSDVHARRFAADGAPATGEFRVNAFTTAFQSVLGISGFGLDGRGNGVVTWSDFRTGATDTFARRLSAAGPPVGDDFQVNAVTAGSQSSSSSAMTPDGRFVVVWRELSTYDIYGRRFDRFGNALGTQFRVNTYTTGQQANPRVALDPAGNFTVVWESYGQDAPVQAGVFGQRYDAGGAPLGGEFQVNTFSTGNQFEASIAVSRAGGFVVAWEGQGPPSGQSTVWARRYANSGVPIGIEFAVTTAPPGGAAQGIVVAMDEPGNFAVTWGHFFPGPSPFSQVYLRRFSANGTPRAAEFPVAVPTGAEPMPRIASDAVGNFVLTWQDTGVDEREVFAQRFGGLFPAGLTFFGGGNSVLEVNEDFGLRPSWRNLTGATQTFQSVISNISFPDGMILTLSPGASYGTVASGAVGECTTCVGGGLTGTRPTGHVDLTFVETIQPDAQGQAKRWALHVGDSFTDVPRSSGFYRYVETMLHRAITAGCGPTTFCPTGATTREQMAVFLLAAKEGVDFAPPPCGVPMFADVPASSPFCRWIEELARRGVTSGCGGTNYCPDLPVTRDQMAVFVLRTLDPALDPPACATPMFLDVPASSPFCRWIEELARRAIVSGCGGGNYCPTAAVTREQMAVFLTGTFGLTLYGP